MEERRLFFSNGDRVLVRGTTDGKMFFDEPGTIANNCYNELFAPDSYIEITFDSWNEGWGDDHRQWACEASTVFLISEENDFSQQDLCISIDQLFCE